MPNIVQPRAFQAFIALLAMAAVPALRAQSPQAQSGVSPAQSQPSAATPAPATPVSTLTPEEEGDALMASQRYQAAIEAYKKGDANSASLWNKMGIAYQLMFNQDAAMRCYERSLKLDPKDATVLNNLGTIYDSLKEYATAERTYRKALKVDPHSALIHKNLGTNLLGQHRYKKGWEEYQQALTIDPHIFEASVNPRIENPATVEDRGAMNYYMAKGCVRAGQNDRAIEYLRMALNEGFTNPKKIIADGEFASLRGIPAFEQLLQAQRTP
jgi:tetratricopeptide (TPR) repeat protein